MDQKQTPLVDMLERFREKNKAYFNIPAHHFARGISEAGANSLGTKVFDMDVTETDGTDDLHCPEEGILRAQMLAADLYGADRTWFLVNGTTCGNEAMILSVAGSGEKIILARDAHKSALMGLILSGTRPIWAYPDANRKKKNEQENTIQKNTFAENRVTDDSVSYELSQQVSPGEIDRLLAENPDAKAVFMTSPSYYGICQPLEEIAQICHRYKVPLLVDEAHGGHLAFHDKLPIDALTAGADLVVQSSHKTNGSLTQTSMLHMHSQLVSARRVDQCLKLVQSTSPSYVLMASLDLARAQMAMEGRELMEKALENALYIRKELMRIEGICVYPLEKVKGKDKYASDPLRIAFSAKELGLTGYDLQEELFRRGVTTELADRDYVLAIVTWGLWQEEADLLIGSVGQIAEQLRELKRSGSQDESFLSANQKSDMKNLSLNQNLTGTLHDQASLEICRNPLYSELKEDSYFATKQIYTPRQAWYGEREQLPLAEAEGRVAAEMIVPYPPGIPLVFPGELISQEIIDQIEGLISQGAGFHGLENRENPRLEILKNIK